MRTRATVLLTAVWIGAAQVAAQTPGGGQRLIDPSAGLTAEQMVGTAFESLPSLRAARAAVAAAEARRTQAGLRPNPNASVGWRQQIGGMDRMNEVGVTLPLDLFRRGARVALADAGVRVAEADARRALLDAELGVRHQYGATLAAVRRAEVARDLEATARRTVELLTARVDEGASPPLDRDLARVELDRMSMRVRTADADADAAVIELTRAIGAAPDAPLRLRATLEALVMQPEVAALSSASAGGAIETRPDVQAAVARVREREAAIDEARAAGRWDLSVSATYVRMRSGFPFRAFDSSGELRDIDATFHNFTAGAMVMVPLFNRNQGAVAAAAAERSGAEADVDHARLLARADMARAAIELRAALDVAKRYRSAIVPQARRNLDTIAERQQLGRGTLFDVLQARQQLLQIEDEYTGALQRAYDAYVAAIGARGGLAR